MVETKTKKYIFAVGRRKCSVARVKLYEKGKGEITINDKKLEVYFPYFNWQDIVKEPLDLVKMTDKTDVWVKVEGGGLKGQAEAVRHAISRAVEKSNKDLRKTLKVAGLLTRDSRVKERKKAGLKRARRAPQWSKR